MRDRVSVGAQGGVRGGRKLWPRRDGLPHRQGISRTVGRAGDVALEGGSIGFQIGGQATDLVLLVMNDRGAQSILSSKVKLGGDASVAAGPVGRDASADTDAYMRAEILSYSRTRGIFAGVSLEGSTLRPDDDATCDVYGRKLTAQRDRDWRERRSSSFRPPPGRRIAEKFAANESKESAGNK